MYPVVLAWASHLTALFCIFLYTYKLEWFRDNGTIVYCTIQFGYFRMALLVVCKHKPCSPSAADSQKEWMGFLRARSTPQTCTVWQHVFFFLKIFEIMNIFWWVTWTQPPAPSLCVLLWQAYSHVYDTCQAALWSLICGLAFRDLI